MKYPQEPGYKTSSPETSAVAAKTIASKAETLRTAALAIFRSGRRLTADQLADYMGEDILSIRPRVSELRAVGAIVDTGERALNRSGKSAAVWAIAPPERPAVTMRPSGQFDLFA